MTKNVKKNSLIKIISWKPQWNTIFSIQFWPPKRTRVRFKFSWKVEKNDRSSIQNFVGPHLQDPGAELHPPDLDFRTSQNQNFVRREGRSADQRLRDGFPHVHRRQHQELQKGVETAVTSFGVSRSSTYRNFPPN